MSKSVLSRRASKSEFHIEIIDHEIQIKPAKQIHLGLNGLDTKSPANDSLKTMLELSKRQAA
jgi:hypothetical protein